MEADVRNAEVQRQETAQKEIEAITERNRDIQQDSAVSLPETPAQCDVYDQQQQDARPDEDFEKNSRVCGFRHSGWISMLTSPSIALHWL